MKDYLKERMDGLARKLLNPGIDLNPALDFDLLIFGETASLDSGLILGLIPPCGLLLQLLLPLLHHSDPGLLVCRIVQPGSLNGK